MLGKSVALYCASFVPVICSFTGGHSATNAIRKAKIGEVGYSERSSIILSFL
jgi:hypothetical protein